MPSLYQSLGRQPFYYIESEIGWGTRREWNEPWRNERRL